MAQPEVEGYCPSRCVTFHSTCCRRGAYEAGVIAGIVEILQDQGHERAPFSIFTGTSVGAINATWLAAHADRPDMNVGGLLERWRSLDLREHLRVSPMRFLWPSRSGDRLGRSFIDPRALEELVQEQIPFGRLHDNVDEGIVQALVVAALNIASTKTTMFAEVAPAIRSGADRLVVVSALHRKEAEADAGERHRRTVAYPSPFFILGKVLNALLLDPINYDLGVMRRFNRLWGVLEETLTTDEMHRVRAVLEETRGVSYRRLEALVFHPSQDIGDITTRHAKRLGAKSLPSVMLAVSARLRAQFESDLLSFVLFDGDFAKELISLGRHDAHRRADDVTSFFRA